MTRHINLSTISLAATAIFTGLMLQSCQQADRPYYINALVTVKPIDGTSGFYMQLDDSTTLWPGNYAQSPFKDKEVRALTTFEVMDTQKEGYDYTVAISYIDSVRTKQTVETSGSTETDNVKYGNEPLEIMRDYTTVVEDGYFTLRFRAEYDPAYPQHSIDLVTGTNKDNPYEVVLHHKMIGKDITGGQINYVQDGIIAFRLNSLPDTEGKDVKLTVKWQSFNGEKTHDFTYRTRPSYSASI